MHSSSQESPLEKKNDDESVSNENTSQNGVIVSDKTSQQQFYIKAQEYWATVPATVNGMLGGLGYVNALDIQASKKFLGELKRLGNNCALDCGAGIGRVSKNLLLPRFNTVDLVEQDNTFAEKARDYCSVDSGTTLGYAKRVGEIYNIGLQHFTPEPNKYDLIWSQWVMGHLTDNDLIAFFQRIRFGLANDDAYFVLKENVTSTKVVEKDENDSSVTRPLKMYEHFLKQAGFRIVKITRQVNFPKGLYPVYMIACRRIS